MKYPGQPGYFIGFRNEGVQDGVDTSNLTGVPVNLLGGKLESAYRRGARSLGDAGILDNMSRRPNKRNAVDMPGCVAAVEIP